MDYDVKKLSDEAVALLEQLISLPSVSREEQQAADCLQAYIEAQGMETCRKGNNIWCMSPGFDLQKPTLLLNSHIDTVKPVSGWLKDPFSPKLESNGKLYGLGSNDAGASVVSLLHVFFELCKVSLSYNLIFLASCEEEISGKGGLECVIPDLPPINFAIVGEPTEKHPAVAEKGLMVIDVEAHGVSGHAARDEGDNAIYKAMGDISWFRNYQFPKVSPRLGPVKMSVTMIHAGTQHNVVPDLCAFTVDVRSNECYSNTELFEIIKENISCEPRARSFRLNSSCTPLDHPLVKRAIDLGRKPFGSPTLSDQALMPFPSMKIGPGKSRRSHTADEFIYVQEIEEAIELYLQLLMGVV